MITQREPSQDQALGTRIAESASPGRMARALADAGGQRAGDPSPGSRLGQVWARIQRNPVLVRELIEGRRSGALRRGVIPALALSGLICFGLGQVPAASHPLLILLAGLGVSLPLAASGIAAGQMHRERERGCLEPLLLTRLAPWEIVAGKFLATLALVLSYWAAALLPALLLLPLADRDVPALLVGSLWLGLGVIVGAATGLGLSSISGRAGQSSLAFGSMGILAPITFFACGLAAEALNPQHGPLHLATLIAGPVLAAALVVWLAFAVAITALRPEGRDRSTPQKIWLIVATQALAAYPLFWPADRSAGPADWGAGHMAGLLEALAQGLVALLTFEPQPRARVLARWAARPGDAFRRPKVWLWRTFGPHPLGNLHFFVALWAFAQLGALQVAAMPEGLRSEAQGTFVLLLAGGRTMALFMAALGAALVSRGRPVAAAIGGTFVVVMVLSFGFSFGAGIAGIYGPELPWFLALSPTSLLHASEVVVLGRGHWTMYAVNTGTYALLSAVLYLYVRRRVQRARA